MAKSFRIGECPSNSPFLKNNGGHIYGFLKENYI
jgi:hypothetical protein